MSKNKHYESVRNSIKLMESISNALERESAFEKDKLLGKKGFYIEHGDTHNNFLVMGTTSGFEYHSTYDKVDAKAHLVELFKSIKEDVLLPKNELLKSNKKLGEDYDTPFKYGNTNDEVVANLLNKYLGITDEVGDILISVEDIKTALYDAISAGAEIGVSDELDGGDDIDNFDSTLSESVIKGKARMRDGSNWGYSINDDTGEIQINTVFTNIPATATIISEGAYDALQNILYNDDNELTLEEKLTELDGVKTEVSIVVRDFFNQSSIQQHISDNVSRTLEAYTGSLALHIDNMLQKR